MASTASDGERDGEHRERRRTTASAMASDGERPRARRRAKASDGERDGEHRERRRATAGTIRERRSPARATLRD
jgi:hypothetical protein